MNRMGLTPELIARAKAEGAAFAGKRPTPHDPWNPYTPASGAEPTSLNRFLGRVWLDAWLAEMQRRAAERKLARLDAGNAAPIGDTD